MILRLCEDDVLKNRITTKNLIELQLTSEITKMIVQDIMTTPVITVELDDSIAVANEIFAKTHFHHLLVVEDHKLLGVVSDRDVLKALSPNIGTASEKQQDIATLNKRIHQIMTRQPICLKPTDRVKRVVEIFDENKISCIPIVDDNWSPLGIVTWRDIIKAIRSKYKT